MRRREQCDDIKNVYCRVCRRVYTRLGIEQTFNSLFRLLLVVVLYYRSSIPFVYLLH